MWELTPILPLNRASFSRGFLLHGFGILAFAHVSLMCHVEENVDSENVDKVAVVLSGGFKRHYGLLLR